MVASSKKIAIGVFDSGIGGLSIVQHLLACAPVPLQVEYIADSDFAPYGPKESAVVIERCQKICSFLAGRKVDAILIACNTATATAIDQLRTQYRIPIIGVEPGLKPALALSANKSIAVLATENTIRSTRFANLVKRLNADGKSSITIKAGVGLVEAIENLDFDCQPILFPLLDTCLDQSVDVLVLGCTHYSYVKNTIERYCQDRGNNLALIDTSQSVASHTIGNILSLPKKQRALDLAEHDLSVASTSPSAAATEALKQAAKALGLRYRSFHHQLL